MNIYEYRHRITILSNNLKAAKREAIVIAREAARVAYSEAIRIATKKARDAYRLEFDILTDEYKPVRVSTTHITPIAVNTIPIAAENIDLLLDSMEPSEEDEYTE